MSHTVRTLELDRHWDCQLTDSGKIRVTQVEPLATAQAVANEARRFVNDSYFNYDIGVPHFDIELAHKYQSYSVQMLRSFIRQAALRVEDVTEILSIELEDFDRTTRTITGIISFKTASGAKMTIGI
jgi:hypothetical protein